jgi:hypothetical protein
MKKEQKLILPVSILLGCIILGGFIYISQVNKQKSIEKQQQIDIQARESQQQTVIQAKIEADRQAKTDKLMAEYREECTVLEEKNSKAFQTTYNNCTSDYCRESIEKFASQNSGVNYINSCVENKTNGTYGGSGIIKKAEKWTGEIFLNGEKISDPNNLPEFLSKQECLDWGNKQKIINKVDSFKCGKNCGTVTIAGEDSYFMCDEEIDI